MKRTTTTTATTVPTTTRRLATINLKEPTTKKFAGRVERGKCQKDMVMPYRGLCMFEPNLKKKKMKVM